MACGTLMMRDTTYPAPQMRPKTLSNGQVIKWVLPRRLCKRQTVGTQNKTLWSSVTYGRCLFKSQTQLPTIQTRSTIQIALAACSCMERWGGGRQKHV